MASEYEELCGVLRKQSTPNIETAIRFLRVVRELKISDPEGVSLYGTAVLERGKSQLGEEEWWIINEQVAVAALSLGQIQYAAGLIRGIAKRFPESMRANRLKGMYWEAQGMFDQAESIYNDMLEKQPSCAIAAKRMVALERSRNNLPTAAINLRTYLDVWPNDRDAWQELADVHLELLNYRQALFCYEELLQLIPGHLPTLIRYADILYTLGGPVNLRVARAYYSKAVELSGGKNVRALWGVTACCANNQEKVTLQDSLTRAVIELPGLTADVLQQEYRAHNPKLLPVVQNLLSPPGSSS